MKWQYVRDIILNILERIAIETILKKLLNTTVMGGVKGWLVKFVVKNYLIDKAAKPLVDMIYRELGYVYDVQKGKATVKKIKKAKEQNDQDAYDRHSDDLFS